MPQRSMVRVKTAIIRRLSPKMSIVHPWMICFDLPMPHQVFDLLNKEILGLTRFGIDTPGSVTITFSNLRRLSYLYDQFQDCGGFRKQLGKGKREAKLIVNSEKKETMVYNVKEQFLRAKFFYGYWNSYGISQDQSTMNRGCKVESQSNKYFPNTSLTKTCQPLCLDNNKKDRMPNMDHCKYSLFFAIFLRNPRNCRNHSFCWAPFYLL